MGFFNEINNMSSNTIAKITLYKVKECGLYERGNDEKAIFGNLEIFLDDLKEWVTQNGKELKETCTYAPFDDKEVKKTFCYDIKKIKNDFLLVTWNESATTTNKVPSISGSSKVGEANINFNNISDDEIPGFPTYFYFMIKEGKVATISFDYTQNGRLNLEKYLKEFFSKLSSHVVSRLQRNTDDSFEHIITGWSDDEGNLYKNLVGRLHLQLIRNKGKIDFLIKNHSQIRKIHQHNKISTIDFLKISGWQSFTNRILRKKDQVNEKTIKFSLETDYQPSNKEELVKILEEWEAQSSLNSKWDDLGFSLLGNSSKVYWLSKSIANDEFELDIERNENNIFDTDKLLNWLNNRKKDILLLEKDKDE
ncbi:hypothetical protein D9M71_22990 [compost metagenome]